MPHQPNLFPSHDSNGSAESSLKNGTPEASRTPLWLRRVELFLRVAVRLYLGLLVLVLPWTAYWEENHFLSHAPWLSSLAHMGGMRGVVSGLGLLNLWIAISEAIRYREYDT